MDRVELSRHIGTHTGGVYCMVGQKQGKGGIIASSDDVLGYLFLRYVYYYTCYYILLYFAHCSFTCMCMLQLADITVHAVACVATSSVGLTLVMTLNLCTSIILISKQLMHYICA
jgi:hypothetical protein